MTSPFYVCVYVCACVCERERDRDRAPIPTNLSALSDEYFPQRSIGRTGPIEMPRRSPGSTQRLLSSLRYSRTQRTAGNRGTLTKLKGKPETSGTQRLLRGRLRLKCDGTRAETRFRLSAKRTSPFKSAGASVQSATGSRDVRISSSNAGYTMFRGSVKGTGYPLHSPVSPSLPLSCVTVYHHNLAGL